MLNGWLVAVVSLAYLSLLFLIASYGDKRAHTRSSLTKRPWVYMLALSIYCTAWTFYGSVGVAATTGYDFLPIYLGPILVFVLGAPLLSKMLRIAKAQNSTSIADFLAARYGRSQLVAVAVTLIAVTGAVPYIALQLKSVATTFDLLTSDPDIRIAASQPAPPWFADTALVVAVMMAAFAALFGTRKHDRTEHHEGMVLAVAFESVVKLTAFLFVGGYIVFVMFGGPGPLIAQAQAAPEIVAVLTEGSSIVAFLTSLLLAMCAIVCLPRQFHVAIVENPRESNLRQARWLFPLYLVAINLFVVPIAVAGLLVFPGGDIDADTFVMSVPLSAGADVVALIAFIGGLSAATGMVIVSTVALSTMVSNEVVVPLLLRRDRPIGEGTVVTAASVLAIRRVSIVAILALAFLFYRGAGQDFPLASIGLLAFAAVAQFAPALLAGLYWLGANRTGALTGICAGFAVWVYTLLLPTLADAGVAPGWFGGGGGASWLDPRHLLGLGDMAALTHGVVWSLAVNTLGVVIGSRLGRANSADIAQALAFVSPQVGPSFDLPRGAAVTVGELRDLAVSIHGERRTEDAFAAIAEEEGCALERDAVAAPGLVQGTERLLAGALGSASARLLMGLAYARRRPTASDTISLLDDASQAIQYNRALLQSTIEHVGQGIAVFDTGLRLVCRNNSFVTMQALPPEFGRIGVTLPEIIRYVADRGEYGPGDVDSLIADRVQGYQSGKEYSYRRTRPTGQVIEVRTTPVPGTGVVATYTDITEQVAAQEALREAKETLERRVEERTRMLSAANDALRYAKAEAEEANRSKTRFLAAASHDLLQPLNAARLFMSALTQRPMPAESQDLVQKAEASLTAVDDLLSALLDISRLDAKAIPTNVVDFHANELIDPLRVEFAAIAANSGLTLRVVETSAVVRSDPKLLRRVLQNFLANAIRYTESGRVLIGCRASGSDVRFEVWDTGSGIPEDKLPLIFEEFRRLDNAGQGRGEGGLGLGLAIVERIARTLDHPLTVRSTPGKGTLFAVTVPRGAEPMVRESTPPSALRPHGKLAGTRVLCLDNEPAILEGMAALLRQWGCRPLLAQSLAEAVRAAGAADEPPSIIVADYHLDDGEDGIQAIQTVRESLGHPLPAILVTADRTERVRELAAEADAIVLNKPLKPGPFRALLTRLIGQARAVGTTDRLPEPSAAE